jgi:REP element-mobilizing transposase RayT
MPRQPRLDSPGLLQHVIVRGIERSDIFRDDGDRTRFVARLGKLLGETGTDCLAWALIPNHFHLLLRPNRGELSRFMRRLLTGYAVTFNRRHRRVGHLFQNRYKSLVCEEEPYLLELVRYIHLNPLRAGMVANLEELDRYPWCGHAVLLGNNVLNGQSVEEVLALFAGQIRTARHNYRRFLADGIRQGNRPELVGGPLRRREVSDDASGPADFDGRVLGGRDFLESLRAEPDPGDRKPQGMDLDTLRNRVADLFQLQPEDLGRRGRQSQNSEARALFCYLGVRSLRHTGVKVGAELAMGVSSVSRAVRRGEDLLASRPDVKTWWDGQLKQ